MTRLLCSGWRNVHVLRNVLCRRVAASNSHGVCRVWMWTALCGRSRVQSVECASRGGVHCRGVGGVGAHAILSGALFLSENVFLTPRSMHRRRGVPAMRTYAYSYSPPPYHIQYHCRLHAFMDARCLILWFRRCACGRRVLCGFCESSQVTRHATLRCLTFRRRSTARSGPRAPGTST